MRTSLFRHITAHQLSRIQDFDPLTGQPRLQGALSLKQKGALKGVNGNRGS